MSYVRQVWLDGESGGTPLSATRLNHMEEGIEEASTSSFTVILRSGLGESGETGRSSPMVGAEFFSNIEGGKIVGVHGKFTSWVTGEDYEVALWDSTGTSKLTTGTVTGDGSESMIVLFDPEPAPLILDATYFITIERLSGLQVTPHFGGINNAQVYIHYITTFTDTPSNPNDYTGAYTISAVFSP